MTNTSLPIALVTGASRGLGAALALELAKTHHVIAVARTTGGLEALDDRIKTQGGQATLAPMDVTNKDAMAHLCRSIFDRFGQIDLWAHTAIYGPALMRVSDLDDKGWSRAWNINVEATRHLIFLVNSLLKDTGTALFFNDDRAGESFFAGYGATKAAQMALVTSWANESKKLGPKVEIHRPAPLASTLRTRFFPGEDRDALAKPSDEAARILSQLNCA